MSDKILNILLLNVQLDIKLICPGCSKKFQIGRTSKTPYGFKFVKPSVFLENYNFLKFPVTSYLKKKINLFLARGNIWFC